MRISYSGPKSLKEDVERAFECAGSHLNYVFNKVSVELVCPGDSRIDSCYGSCEEGFRILGSIEDISSSLRKGDEKSVREWALHEIAHCILTEKTKGNPYRALIPFNNIDEGAAYAVSGKMQEYGKRQCPERLAIDRMAFESLMNIFPSSLVIQAAADAINNAVEKNSAPREELFMLSEEKEACLRKGIAMLF